MGAQFFAACLADQCACPLSPVLLSLGAHALVTRPGVCAVDSLLPPSLKRLPPTLIFSDLLSQTLPRRFSCSPTRTFPSSPATKSCPRHPTRHLPASLNLTRRPPADEIPRDLGFICSELHPPVDCFPPTVAAFPSTLHPAQNSTAPHLTSHSPLPRLTSSTTGACPAHQRRSSCDDPGTASSAPPPPAPSQRQSDYRISYSALGLTAIPRSRQHSTTSADNHIRPLPNKIFVRSTPKKSTQKRSTALSKGRRRGTSSPHPVLRTAAIVAEITSASKLSSQQIHPSTASTLSTLPFTPLPTDASQPPPANPSLRCR